MLTLLVWLACALGPEPVPLEPPPNDAYNDVAGPGPGLISWNNRPWRPTLYWRRGGLLWCDDPDCLWCADEVYGVNRWPSPPIRIRR